jgi:hypothetical protein
MGTLGVRVWMFSPVCPVAILHVVNVSSLLVPVQQEVLKQLKSFSTNLLVTSSSEIYERSIIIFGQNVMSLFWLFFMHL